MRDDDAADRIRSLAASVVAAAVNAQVTLATAESLTGGAVCAALVGPPGASAVVRGGVVAYLPDVKRDVLGVDAGLIAEHGVVSEETAQAMARGARGALDANLTVATTGAAGPEDHDGAPAGTVCLAVTWEGGVRTRTLHVDGDRAQVTAGAVEAALELLASAIGEIVLSRDCAAG